VKFLFATTEAHKLPATMISRCQRFDLQPIRDEVAAKHLLAIAKQEKVALDPAAAEVIARASEGGMRDAESMLDQVVSFCGDKVAEEDVLSIFGFASAEDVASLGGHILAGDAASALNLVAVQGEAGKDLGRLLADLVMTRDLLVSEVTAKELPGGAASCWRLCADVSPRASSPSCSRFFRRRKPACVLPRTKSSPLKLL